MNRICFMLFVILIPSIAFGQITKTISQSTQEIAVEVNPPAANLYNTLPAQNSNVFNPSFMPLQLAETDPRLTISYFRKNGSLWISGTPLSIVNSRTNDLQSQVYTYLEECRQVLNIADPKSTYKIVDTHKDDLGFTHFKLEQNYRGIKIYGSELLIHGKEKLSSLNGFAHTINNIINIIPSFPSSKAIDIVIEDLPEYLGEINDPFNLMPEDRIQPELVILPTQEGYKLSYHIIIHSTLIDRWEYFLDAHSGNIIERFESICKFHNHELSEVLVDGEATANVPDLFGTMRNINTYEVNSDFFMIDASRDMFDGVNSIMPNEPVGVIWTIDAFNTSPQKDDFLYDHVFSADNSWSGQETAVSAHYNAGTTYDYFKETHNRESINASGNNIISLVNIADSDGSSLENAFWNGAAMFYGNGGTAFDPLAKGLDVAAHEISHGVIQNTANLEYKGESGALNESYADIFGAMVDRDDWLIGEDVVKSSTFPSGALRSLKDPHNGASENDYGRGYQPKSVSEQYTGSQDNGGVHINSGIPNHAFYLFANSIGKDKAEQVFYRALTTYLLKSSKFIDQRLAVVQAAMDLYGDGNEVQAARQAFDQVEIFNGEPGNYQEDIESNPGSGFLLLSDDAKSNLYIYDENLELIANPFSEQDHISKPSVNDDGTIVVFIGDDKKMYFITIDWEIGEFTAPVILQDQPIWRNVIISKDGRRIAGLFDDETRRIWVYDFVLDESNEFELFNPTFTEGVSTGDVQFPDAMEFDFTGEFIMYDALNEISSTSSGSIEYWDIGFLKVWDKSTDFWSLGSIEKLFSALPEGISVGNPTFSKNSDYIIAFEVIEGSSSDIYGANLQTGELNVLFNNTVLSYPGFNIDDTKIVHDLNIIGTTELGELEVDATKINTVPNSESFLIQDSRWGVWFANGQRDFSSSVADENKINLFTAYPNPTSEKLTIQFDSEENGKGLLEIYGVNGIKLVSSGIHIFQGENSVTQDVKELPEGILIARITTGSKSGSILFYKGR